MYGLIKFMVNCLQEKIDKINSILAMTNEEIIQMLTEKWILGIKNSPLYAVWDKKNKSDEQCVVEVLRCELESIKGILEIFKKA